MPHSNAALTRRHRLKIARLVVGEVADQRGRRPVPDALADGAAVGRPLPRGRIDGRPVVAPQTSPNKTSRAVMKRCISLQIRLREGPVQLAARLGIAPSTVHRILASDRLHRLSYIDRATSEPIRRYEHSHPGSLVHVDVKKIGNIPDGGGWRYVGRRRGEKNRAATPGKPRNKYGGPILGYRLGHTVIDDHSQVAYTEVHDDETATTAVAVLHRAVDWFADRGVSIERVLSDNGGPYRSHLRGPANHANGTRSYRPQTNGKVERFHRTMADGWAYARGYTSEQERRDALSG